MKSSQIHDVLDIAYKVRVAGRRFIPCFSGDPGLGKSYNAQDWAKQKAKTIPGFGFIDLRLALREGPDLTGKPFTETVNGVTRTRSALPAFWPTDPNSSGLLLLEEPNRANTWVTNCIMQLLTDRKMDVGGSEPYELPSGWMIAACINEGTAVDVNTMDAALRNRFSMFDVKYDRAEFVDYMESNNWHPGVVSFVKGGVFQFKSAEEIKEDSVYVSPRTLEVISNLELENIHDSLLLHSTMVTSVLGKEVGSMYHKFRYDESPVTYEELKKNKKKALERLSKFIGKDGSPVRSDIIALTIQDIVDNFPRPSTKKDRELLYDLVQNYVGLDQGTQMLTEIYSRDKDEALGFNKTEKSLETEAPDLFKLLVEKLKGQSTYGKNKEKV